MEVAALVSVEDVADVDETGGAGVGETGDADVGETGGAASSPQPCLSSPIVLNIVVLRFPSPRFSPSHLSRTLMGMGINHHGIRLFPVSTSGSGLVSLMLNNSYGKNQKT